MKLILNKNLLCLSAVLFIMLNSINSKIICEGHIYDVNERLSETKLSEACNIAKNGLKNGQLIIFRYQKNVEVKNNNIDSSCDKDNEEFRKAHCDKYCSDTIIISVFFEYKKIRITTGNNLTKKVDFQAKNKIIEALGKELKKGFPEDGFNAAAKLTSNYIANFISKPKTPLPHSTTKKVVKVYKNDQSSSFLPILISIIFLAVICVCMYFIISKQQEAEVKISREAYQPVSNSDEKNESEKIHNHVNSLLNYIKDDIKKNTPPVTSIDKCIVCVNELNPNWKQEEANAIQHGFTTVVTTSACNIERFSCGHFYHKKCLTDKKLNECIMCTCNVNRVEVFPSYKYYNTISEENVQNAIKNLDKMYKKDELKLYAQNYKQDVVVIKETCPTYVHTGPTMIWINEPYHPSVHSHTTVTNNYYESGHNNGNFVEGNRNNNYDYGTSSGGNYQEGGIAGSTTGGDYGGNDYDGGDYDNAWGDGDY